MAEALGFALALAVGFALGDAVLELLLKNSKLWPKEQFNTDYFIVLTDEKYIDICIRMVESLRRRGFTVDWDLLKRNVKAQMKYADRLGARKTVFIGEDELRTGNVSVKDMVTGEQKCVAITEFYNSRN